MNQSPSGIFRGWNRAFMSSTAGEDESNITGASYRTGVTTASSRGSTVGYSTDGSYDSDGLESADTSVVSSEVGKGRTTSLLRKATANARSYSNAKIAGNNHLKIGLGVPEDTDSPEAGSDKYGGASTRASTRDDTEDGTTARGDNTISQDTRYTAYTDFTGYTAYTGITEYSEETNTTKGANTEYTRDQSNRLHELIEDGGWEDLMQIINTPRGRQMAAVPHPWGDGDLPIHLVIGYDFDLREREKQIRKKRKAERKAKIIVRAKARGETVERSDSEAEESDSESDSDDEREKRAMPPAEVILEFIKAFPSAIRTKGYGGCLPLHHAARLNYPKEVVIALIRAYPQGLDVRDNNKLSPRDYEIDFEDPEVEALLDRPSSCWIQQIRDEDTHNTMDEELEALEKDVKELTDDLTKCIEEEQTLQKRLVEIEEHITTFGAYRQGKELEKRTEVVQESIEKEAEELRSRTEALFGLSSLKYVEDEKEREYIAAFNEDVRKIYTNINEDMEEMKSELAKLVRSL